MGDETRGREGSTMRARGLAGAGSAPNRHRAATLVERPGLVKADQLLGVAGDGRGTISARSRPPGRYA